MIDREISLSCKKKFISIRIENLNLFLRRNIELLIKDKIHNRMNNIDIINKYNELRYNYIKDIFKAFFKRFNMILLDLVPYTYKKQIIKEVNIYVAEQYKDKVLSIPLTNSNNFYIKDILNFSFYVRLNKNGIIYYYNYNPNLLSKNEDLILNLYTVIEVKYVVLTNNKYEHTSSIVYNSDIINKETLKDITNKNNVNDYVKELDYHNNLHSHLVCNIKRHKNVFRYNLLQCKKGDDI